MRYTGVISTIRRLHLNRNRHRCRNLQNRRKRKRRRLRPPDDSAPAVSHPTPPPEGDNYNEDEEYMRHMANTDEGPQPGAVDADDLLVLLSVFSKGKSATQQEIATARRAMRAVSGSQIEQAILDQLNGKDGYVAVMLDMITKDLHAEDDAPPRENKKSDRAFRLEDFV